MENLFGDFVKMVSLMLVYPICIVWILEFTCARKSNHCKFPENRFLKFRRRFILMP